MMFVSEGDCVPSISLSLCQVTRTTCDTSCSLGSRNRNCGGGGNCLRKGGEQEMTARLSVMVGGLPPVREMKEGGGGRALDFSESHLS